MGTIGITITSDNVTIANLTFQNSTRNGPWTGSGLKVDGSNNLVSDLVVRDIPHNGVYVLGENNTFRNISVTSSMLGIQILAPFNVLRDSYFVGGQNNVPGIKITGTHNITVENNYVESGWGITVTRSNDTFVRWNTINAVKLSFYAYQTLNVIFLDNVVSGGIHLPSGEIIGVDQINQIEANIVVNGSNYTLFLGLNITSASCLESYCLMELYYNKSLVHHHGINVSGLRVWHGDVNAGEWLLPVANDHDEGYVTINVSSFSPFYLVGEPYLDSDGDGLTDDIDSCPYVAEDFDGYQDNDGCPEDNPNPPGGGGGGSSIRRYAIIGNTVDVNHSGPHIIRAVNKSLYVNRLSWFNASNWTGCGGLYRACIYLGGHRALMNMSNLTEPLLDRDDEYLLMIQPMMVEARTREYVVAGRDRFETARAVNRYVDGAIQ